MRISSVAFGQNQRIPQKYTCDGKDMRPPLTFEDVPELTRSLALVMDDPDAPGGTWDHWVVWNMPETTTDLDEAAVPPGILGKNSWRKNRYGGPCPPDREHRYLFTLYALDTTLGLPAKAGTRELAAAMHGHVLARAELVGRYERTSDSARLLDRSVDH
jgi:Raf kinase inhibitor-like YbhB/YbcL family protein